MDIDKMLNTELSPEEYAQGLSFEAFVIETTINKWVITERITTRAAIDHMLYEEELVEKTTLDDERGYTIDGVRLKMTTKGLLDLVGNVAMMPKRERNKKQRANESRAMANKAKKNKAKKRQAKKQRKQQRKRK